MTAPHRHVCTLVMPIHWSNQATGSSIFSLFSGVIS